MQHVLNGSNGEDPRKFITTQLGIIPRSIKDERERAQAMIASQAWPALTASVSPSLFAWRAASQVLYLRITLGDFAFHSS